MRRSSMYKKLLFLAIPMIIQSGITNMVGLVDNVMVGSVGSVGTEAMTSVTIVGQLIFVFFLAIFGGLSGPGIYGAQFYGNGDTEGVRKVFRLKMWIALACSAAALIIFFMFGKELIGLYLRGDDGGLDVALTLEYALSYLRIMMIGILPIAIVQVYASSLRECGESLLPMIASVCSVVTDVVLNYLLIYGNFGFPKLGVQGAAIATVIARFVETAVLLIASHVKRKKFEFLQGIYRTMLVPKSLAKAIMAKGAPVFVNELFWSLGMALLTQCYSLRGLDVVAAINIANALSNVLLVVFTSLGAAAGIVMGQYLGASQFDQAQKSARPMTIFATLISVILMIAQICLSKAFPQIYTTTDEIRHLGSLFIIVIACSYPLQGAVNAVYFIIRSGGKTFISLIMDSGITWGVCLPIAYGLCLGTDLPILMVYAIVMSCDTIKIVLGAIIIKKRIWLSNIVE